jgi:hypothetical protein
VSYEPAINTTEGPVTQVNVTAKEIVAQWMITHGFATGHGDTLEDLLRELSWQIEELRIMKEVQN